jgi:hypothetical protein
MILVISSHSVCGALEFKIGVSLMGERERLGKFGSPRAPFRIIGSEAIQAAEATAALAYLVWTDEPLFGFWRLCGAGSGLSLRCRLS